MPLCAICALTVPEGATVCSHHITTDTDKEWSDINRAACNLIHRGIVPVVPPSDPLPTEPIVERENTEGHPNQNAEADLSHPSGNPSNDEPADGANNDSVDPQIA